MKKRILRMLLAVMIMATLSTVAPAAEEVSYVEYSWNEATGLSSETKTVTEYTEVASGTTTWENGWYVVKGDVTIGSRVTVSGKANLILTDGCSLTIPKGIHLSRTRTLIIYGQSGGTGTLTAGTRNQADRGCAGIGGNYSSSGSCGTITVHGGILNAQGGSFAAGIGGGETTASADGGDLTIYHGSVTATAGGGTSGVAGIGAGNPGPTIGDIGNTKIYGGTVTAHSNSGPALGGCLSGGSILIAGGVVNASSATGDTAVIGGYNTYKPSVKITGGVVNIIKGGASSYLGNGRDNMEKVSITGGIIYKDNSGTVYGETTLEQDLVIPAGKSLNVPKGAKLIIPDGVTLTNSGTLTIMGEESLGGNGTLTGTGSYVLTPSLTVPDDLVYTGQDQTDSVTQRIVLNTSLTVKGKLFVSSGTDFSPLLFSPASVTDAGTYTVTSTYTTAGGGSDTVTNTFTVAKADLQGVAVSQYNAMTYNGKDQRLAGFMTAVAVPKGGAEVTFAYSLTEGKSYTTDLTLKNAGTYTVYYKISAANHNDVTGSVSVTVRPFTLTDSNTSVSFAPMTYTGQEQTPTGDLVVDLGGGNTETVTNAVWSAVTGVTDTTAHTAPSGNFKGTITKATGMARLDLSTVTVKAVNNPAYNGTEQIQQITAEDRNGTVITGYTVSGDKGTNVKTDGNYVLTVSAGENTNYIGEKTFEWNIDPADIIVCAVVPETWWGETPVIEAADIVGEVFGSDVITVSGLTVSPKDAEAVGSSATFEVDSTSAVVSGHNHTNYEITFMHQVMGKVHVIPLTVSGVAMDAESYTYGGDPVGYNTAALSVSQPGGTAAKAEDLVYTYTGTANDGSAWNSTAAPTKAGSYTLTVTHTDTAHYSGSQEVRFTVKKAPATVTAETLYYPIGTALPDGSAPEVGKHYTVDGLIGEDSIGTVTMKYRKDGADVTPDINTTGTYDIVIEVSNIDPNYDVSTVDGKLTYTYTYTPVYKPAVESTDGGKVSVNIGSPVQGQTVTVTPKPDEGYEVEKVTVTDRNGNPVEVTDNGDGTYSFNQPAESVTVAATFKPEACLSAAYSDLDTALWYHEATDYVLANGLMNGVGGSLFDPNGTTTRAMIVTILWRLEGQPATDYAMQFEDVVPGAWYTEAVRWAASRKIVEGWNGSFDPTGEITREQFAAILWRYAKDKGYNVSVGENTNILSYEDALSISEYAIPAMQWACGAGVMQGDGAKLTPKASATRVQAAALFQRFCENAPKQ